MIVCGLQKLTLLDFPGLVACTIFLKGCNFRCPFCQNKDLVFPNRVYENIDVRDVFNYLKERKNVLDGVCITGGEPTLSNDLEQFIKDIKDLGLKVKLDTNGDNPKVLKNLVEKGLLDYVAMDVKNSLAKYGETAGVKNFDTSRIEESINFLKEGKIEYEFRTTVVKEFHESNDFIELSKLLKGCSKYYLQQFRDSETCIQQGLHACSEEEMKEFVNILKNNGINAFLRGME